MIEETARSDPPEAETAGHGAHDSRRTLVFHHAAITLIGTAHVSRESINEVDRVIRAENPDLVCVELDGERFAAISGEENWTRLDLAKVFREGKGFLLMANLVLSGFQRRMGNELGVKPGEEMITAAAAAKELGIPCELADRNVQTTLRRAWGRCGLWSKCKLLASLVSSAITTEKLSAEEIESLKTRGELDGMMKELARYLPAVKETLIDERDRYLAAKIWTAMAVSATAARTGGNGGEKTPRVIAVVGAGHLAGIAAHLEAIASGAEDADITELERIPPKSFLARAAAWMFPALLAGLVVLGFFRLDFSLSLAMLLRWLFLNGSLAALGAILALGHPLSILASFAGAPIGTLSPVISVGFISALVEASVRRPRVTDTETLSADVGSLKGIYRNRITRALLVFFLSSIGGMIGNAISIPALAGLLSR
ncbi:MAG: TraB/GumN family protein [Spirochaetaceae bacterium]|jgi:pheromone shutdown-related protein TraB|nr:TraB/GumN family protein [Spirochaetaceae bacterium]